MRINFDGLSERAKNKIRIPYRNAGEVDENISNVHDIYSKDALGISELGLEDAIDKHFTIKQGIDGLHNGNITDKGKEKLIEMYKKHFYSQFDHKYLDVEDIPRKDIVGFSYYYNPCGDYFNESEIEQSINNLAISALYKANKINRKSESKKIVVIRASRKPSAEENTYFVSDGTSSGVLKFKAPVQRPVAIKYMTGGKRKLVPYMLGKHPIKRWKNEEHKKWIFFGEQQKLSLAIYGLKFKNVNINLPSDNDNSDNSDNSEHDS